KIAGRAGADAVRLVQPDAHAGRVACRPVQSCAVAHRVFAVAETPCADERQRRLARVSRHRRSAVAGRTLQRAAWLRSELFLDVSRFGGTVATTQPATFRRGFRWRRAVATRGARVA